MEVCATHENVLIENSVEENMLFADEELTDFVSALEEKLYADVTWLKDHGSVNAATEEIHPEGCMEHDECIVVPPTTEIRDYYTPHGIKRSINNETDNKRTKWNDCNESCIPQTPLPLFSWTDSKGLWDIMMHKADVAMKNRNARLFQDTLTILPRMRAILVEWIMEVCDVYHLRRSSFYLAIDYIDRFLSINPHIPKTQLQLLGITSLYIATKFDEIYTPKISEFAYVCDGVCREIDILSCEKVLLNTLSWDINPMTPISWLNLYMQIYFNLDNKTALIPHPTESKIDESQYFLYPQYSAYDFVKASHLIDLLAMDPCYLLFAYNVIAASAMYFLYGRGCALKVSGLQWKDLENCIEYMAVFYTIVRDTEDPKLDSLPAHIPLNKRDRATFNYLKHRIPSITYGEYHALQTRSVGLDYWERSCILRMQRIGFNITKKGLAQCTVQTDQPNGKDPDKQEKKEKPDTVEKYVVKRDCSINVSSFNQCDSDRTKHTRDTEFFDQKSEFTFDELLQGINESTINKLLVPTTDVKHSTSK